jgi:UDP-N-acetylmuramoyl-L-alanyl-D-glutamate--2,6-diaminopimelate ligase
VHTQGKLICIFGCGGNRDSSKRVLMGRIAKQYADSIVLTQDNSRNEKPSTIIADIQKGLHDLAPHQSLSIELDREKAICQTWQASSVGDIILVAGKGHEDYLEINNQRIDYNERNIVRRLTSAVAPRTNTPSAQSSRGPQ